MKSKLYASLAVSALALAFSGYASAAAIDCDPEDATAQGADDDSPRFADLCRASNDVGANTEAETDFVNSFLPVFGEEEEENFTYIGKWENDGDGDGDFEDSDPSFGFTLVVTGDMDWDGDGYKYSYTLTAGIDHTDFNWAGQTIDWVLGIKQAQEFTAYYWEAITLDIDGKFNSYWINPQEKKVNDYSHAAGFVRLAEGTGPIGDIPEPATLGLLGIGLFGLGMASYRRRRLASTEV